MDKIDDRILKFLNSNHLASICVLYENAPYAFNAFYVFDKDYMKILFASSSDTTHIKAIKTCNLSFATIAHDTKIIAQIEGIQLRGKISNANKYSKKIYFKAFAYAKIMNPEIFEFKIEWLKYTNNTLGFGKKICLNLT